MSVNYRSFAAVGFKIIAEEVSHLSEEDYEYLLDENRLILLNSYTSKSDYIFIKDGSYKSADEGDTTSILSLYSRLDYKHNKEFIKEFKHYFPDSKAQLDILLACQVW